MNKLSVWCAAVVPLLIFVGNANATAEVPDIDGSGAVLALGLTAGLIALIRARRDPK